MAIQVRRGNEADFDAEKMLPGEWAVSLDTKYVRMCFSPGVCLRMATYEAFEADMAQIQAILEEAQTIEEAIQRVSVEVSEKAVLVEEYTAEAKLYRDEAKQYRDEAFTLAPEGYENIMQDVEELRNQIVSTTSTTLSNSHAGGVKINSLHGASEQAQYSGAQLFDGNLVNGYRELDGTYYETTTGVYKTFEFSSDETKEYTLSFSETVFLVRSTVTELNTTGNVFTFVAEAGSHYVSFRREDRGVWEDSSEIMLNAGTTTLPYEPYVGGVASPNPDYPQEIESVVVSQIKSVGKNLLPIIATSQTINGVTFTVNEDGSITAKGTATSAATLHLNYPRNFAEAGATYIVSAGGAYEKGKYVFQWWRPTEDGSAVIDKGDGFTITYSGNEKNNISIYVYIGTTIDTTFYPMIRKADITDDTYEPYQESTVDLSEPITLRGNNDVKDYIDVERGKVVRKFVERVFDGSDDENWVVTGTNTDGVYRLECASLVGTVKPALNNSTVANIMCDSYIATTAENTYQKKAGISISTGKGYTHVYDENFNTSDISLWKAHLASKSITVVAELATPIEEDLPTADQIALRNLSSFDTVTYISSDSEIEPSWNLEYGTSKVGAYTLEARNVAKRNEVALNELTTAVLALNQE